jgi:hypothetical protein
LRARDLLAGQPGDPDNASPARQPGLQHAPRGTKTQLRGSRSPSGPTMLPPAQAAERPGT